VHHVDPSAAPRSWLSGKSFFVWRFYVLQGMPGHQECLLFAIGFAKMAA
jgi:hypothetical protein